VADTIYWGYIYQTWESTLPWHYIAPTLHALIQVVIPQKKAKVMSSNLIKCD